MALAKFISPFTSRFITMPTQCTHAEPRGLLGARIVDLVAAALATAALLPLILWRAAWGRAVTGRWIEWTPALGRGGRVISLAEFSGNVPGRGLARIINLFRGDLAIAGPRPARIGEFGRSLLEAPGRFSVRPGIVNIGTVRELVGIATDSETASDLEFCSQHRWYSGIALSTRWIYARCLAGQATGPDRHFVELLGVMLANTTMDDAVNWITTRARARRRTVVAFANPDCLNIAQWNPRYCRALRGADRIFSDGIGIRIACRMLGQKMLDNVNGTDMFPHLCRAAARDGLRVFLLGARPGIAASAATRMQEQIPGLQIAGTMHGYFDAAETAQVVSQINASDADILLVAMGAPQQEIWLARNEAALSPPVRLGVGGLFDYYSGRISRAPAWIREAGFEWVWRMGCEPSRLWKRYIVGNPLFLARVMRERLTSYRPSAAAAIQIHSPAGRVLAGARSWARIRGPAIRETVAAVGKRALDATASAAAIVVLSPVFLLTALAIRLDSPGPVIFRQQRVGRDGQPFTMLKFRSMFADAEQRRADLLARNEMDGGVIFKIKRDPRVTRVGQFIRRTSLDELPQLFNVLLGEMSLVGPRPPLPSEVAQYSLRDRGRLDATPGITCTWQVSGRSEIPFEQQVDMDLDYIHRQSLTEDVRLLLKTVPALLRGRGAY
jgi:exopolysaccharide biosynthesis WecB/TagA/CpsF family protein